jgi:predicted glycosyltransferase
MKIWFDLSNAPHINLFKDLLKDLESEGHEIIVTCRPLSNTVSLLDLHKINYTIIGKHYGKSIVKKTIGYPVRVRQLQKFLKPLKPDIAISQSSFHSPLAARLLRIPSIYMNDNEHAMGNIPSFICATRVMIPEFLNIKKAQKQGASFKKIIAYPGVKEGIYLWQKYLLDEPGKQPGKTDHLKIYIRPEPRTAQYYKGGENFLDEVIVGLKDQFKIIILTRDESQFEYYRSSKFAGVQVPDKPTSFNQIADDCQLFIGAGGTMTREMAVIGIPTISVYQDNLLDVDQYLINSGLMQHLPKLKTENVLNYIQQNYAKPPDKTLLLKGKEAYYLIKSLIEQITTNA